MALFQPVIRLRRTSPPASATSSGNHGSEPRRISFVKVTPLTERISLKYALDIFNLTNTTSFDVPIDDVSQNQFYNNFPQEGQPLYNPPSGLGIVNKTIGSPRQIQMTLRVMF